MPTESNQPLFLLTTDRAAFLKTVVQTVRCYLPKHYRLCLFGSQAGKSALSRSDVDLGILGFLPLDLVTLDKITAALEDLPTLALFDVVDLTAASVDFRRQALRQAEWLD